MNITFNYSKKPFETYVSFDPAIDHDKSNITEYMKTRDVSHLQFKPGMKPTKFYLKNIPRALFMASIVPASSPSTQALLAFQYGIDRIDDLKETFLNEDVNISNNGIASWEPTELITFRDIKIKHISQEDLENVFNMQTIMELGAVILKKTQSVPGIKQEYPVLPTSIELIQLQLHQKI